MARKYDLISELYRRTAHAVVSDVQNWQAFLRCACRNYRLRFDEQLLIYAQRPDRRYWKSSAGTTNLGVG